MTLTTVAYFDELGTRLDSMPGGFCQAWSAYSQTKANESSVFETGSDLHLPDKHIPDFVKALRESGIKKILVTDQSTALMRILSGMENAGCTVTGMGKVSRKARPFDTKAVDGRIEVPGIVVQL